MLGMVISHVHRYLFIEIPITASSAIHTELCQHYDGVPILHKHASYPEFRRTATARERTYFVFAAVRNPLDKLVSRYFKLKTYPEYVFSEPERTRSLTIDYSDRRKREYIRRTTASFHAYFREYCRRPYGSLIDVSSKHVDYVIHFERLQDDFSQVLDLLDLTQVRPVPTVKKTREREADWTLYYTPDIIEQAKKVCGPFMKKWGYEFPTGWGDCRISWSSHLEYRLVGALRNTYLTHFRYSTATHARMIRRLRARLIK
jgi:hypothetical protein